MLPFLAAFKFTPYCFPCIPGGTQLVRAAASFRVNDVGDVYPDPHRQGQRPPHHDESGMLCFGYIICGIDLNVWWHFSMKSLVSKSPGD